MLWARYDRVAIAGRRRSGLVDSDVMAYERRREGRGMRERGFGEEQMFDASCAGAEELNGLDVETVESNGLLRDEVSCRERRGVWKVR